MSRNTYKGLPKGFSLVELLVAMGIIGIISVLVVGTITSIKGGRALARAGTGIAGILEQARAYAMANNTYVWVGFEEEPNDVLVVGVAASRNGWNKPLNTEAGSANSDLEQLDRIERFENVKIVALPNTLPHRKPDDGVTQFADVSSSLLSFALGAGANRRAFTTRAIQFNSRGEARISSQISKTVEIGLQGAVDHQIRNGSDYVAAQVGRLSGSVLLYRP